MRKVIYLKESKADIKEISAYIVEMSGSFEAAERFVATLRAQCRKIAGLATLLGRQREDLRNGIRTFPFKGYVLVFRYEKDRLEVVNIIHGARDIEAMFQDKGED